MYTDLANIYERAGRIDGKEGSITQMPILVMPQDDITHPIPDLTGYITEGQIVLSRELNRKGIYPPVDVLPSLSPSYVRHSTVHVKAFYTKKGITSIEELGVEYARNLVSFHIVQDTISQEKFIEFAEEFEGKFITQSKDEDRSIIETLDLGWDLLKILPKSELKRVKEEFIEQYLPKE